MILATVEPKQTKSGLVWIVEIAGDDFLLSVLVRDCGLGLSPPNALYLACLEHGYGIVCQVENAGGMSAILEAA